MTADHYPLTKRHLSRRCSWPPGGDHQVCILPEERMLSRVLEGKVIPVIQGEELSNTTEGSNVTVTSDRRRRIASMFQHYYPEGGWGLILMLVVIIVQILIHGLVLAFGVVLAKILRRFRASITEAGEFANVLKCLCTNVLFQHKENDGMIHSSYKLE